MQKVPRFMCWIRYLSFNYHTYKVLLKIQCGNDDGGGMQVGEMLLMTIGYRLITYILLRRMSLTAP